MRLAPLFLILAACGSQPLDTALEADILALEGDATAGAAPFEDNCQRCHGADGGGAVTGPSIVGETAGEAVEAMLTGPGRMPTFDERLDEQTVADVAAFVESL